MAGIRFMEKRRFKRVSGPSNRRNPSRPQRRASQEHPNMDASPTTDHQIGDNHNPPPKARLFLELDNSDTHQDVNHNASKPSISFLNQREDSSPDKSPTANRKPYVPPLDLSILHEHGDGSDPIPAEQGFSVSLQKVNQYKEDDEAVLSPRMSKLKFKKNPDCHSNNHGYHRYDKLHRHGHSYGNNRQTSAHPDTDVPPSPPTDQTHIPSKRGVDDENTVAIKQLTKKIQSCKKRIKVFEEGFEQEHGYRPSQTDKASRPEIRRSMQELQRARKELKTLANEKQQEQHMQNSVFTFDVDPLERFNHNAETMALPVTDPRNQELKEDVEAERRAASSSPSGLAVLPNGRTSHSDHITSPDLPPTMDQTLQMLLKKLADKREDENRPEDLAEETREETLEEKLAVQKALLHFESIHGRPTTKSEKSLMRPLYDRYRNIKRILAKPVSPRDKTNELQSVPEDHPIEFTPTPSTAHSTDRPEETVRVPAVDQEEHEDFMVTKDFRLMKGTLRPSDTYSSEISPDGDEPRNLHELTVPQLLDEQRRGRADKKRLRKVLREFEEDYLRQTGRKVQKEDRAPMETEYNEYKQVKARLKLMDALISKHDPMAGY